MNKIQPLNQLFSPSELEKNIPVSYPRIIFPSIQAALEASPYFIDEEQVGPWLSSSDQDLNAFGTVFTSTRNAIHIPSLEQTGEMIPESVVAFFCQRAISIGLTQIRGAIGYWTLASTGALQKERIKIVFSEEFIDPDVLRNLAREIIVAANQEAVAIEISGRVEQYFG